MTSTHPPGYGPAAKTGMGEHVNTPKVVSHGPKWWHEHHNNGPDPA